MSSNSPLPNIESKESIEISATSDVSSSKSAKRSSKKHISENYAKIN